MYTKSALNTASLFRYFDIKHIMIKRCGMIDNDTQLPTKKKQLTRIKPTYLTYIL